MARKQHQQLGIFLSLFVLMMSLVMPLTAQESTAEAVETDIVNTEVPTEAPTDIPAETPETGDDVPVNTPEVDATLEATEDGVEVTPPSETTSPPESTPDVTDVAPEATSEVSDEADETNTPESTAVPDVPTEPTTPVEPVEVTSYTTDFESGAQDWSLDGWAVISETTTEGDFNSENSFLTTTMPESQAGFLAFNEADLRVTGQYRLDAGNTALVAFRAGEQALQVMFNAYGSSRLYVGTEVVATSTLTPPADAEPTWFDFSIMAVGDVVIVNVNGADSIIYQGVMSQEANSVTFLSGINNEGAVALDNVMLEFVDASTFVMPVIPTPSATPVPTELPVTDTPEEDGASGDIAPEATAEATEEADEFVPEVTVEAEVTPEIMAEVTEEAGDDSPEMTQEADDIAPEMTVEAEVTPEVIVETPEVIVPSIIASANFENELVGWTTQASVVDAGETNNALLLTANSTLALNELPTHSASQFDVNIMRLGEATLTIALTEDTNLVVGMANISLVQGDVVLAEGEFVSELNVWATLSVMMDNGALTVTMDGAPVLATSFDSAMTLLSFASDGNLMLDDIVVRGILEEEVVEELVIEVDVNSKLNADLQTIFTLFESGDLNATYAAIAEMGIAIDEEARIRLVIWTNDVEATSALVAELDGVVNSTRRYQVDAFIGLDALVAIVSDADVSSLELPVRATSTGPIGSNTSPGFGSGLESFDTLGLEEWHAAGDDGNGVQIAVIDTGFSGISTSGDQACVATTSIYTGTGAVASGNHGISVMEVLCDVAPGSDAYAYVATDGLSLANAISRAISDGRDVILIAIDLGASFSGGDGTDDISPVNNSPYYQIQQAYNAGIPVIVSAGNNTGRYVTFTYSGSGTSATISNASVGDTIHVWGSASLPTVSASGTSTIQNGINSKSYTVTSAGTITVSFSGAANATIQLQIASETANITSDPTNVVAGAGTLGRPADSPYAITVGAVEAINDQNFPLYANSSIGPVFNSSGTPDTSAGLKPEIVSLTDVTTSGGPSGLSGTSGAAAHVAGMVALLKSNDDNPSFDTRFNTGTSTDVNNIEDYLMTRSVERPFGNSADGYDYTYGAGMTVLGAPSYNLDQSTATRAEATNFRSGECTGDIIYVGQNDPDPLNEGGTSPSDHYTHLAYALQQVDSDGDCVIVLPGEYVSSLLLEDLVGINETSIIAYSEVTPEPPALFANSIFRIADAMYYGTEPAQVYITATSTDYLISGFVFDDVTRWDDLASLAFSPRAVYASSAQDITLRKNTFDISTIFNYPIITLNGGSNVTITNNVFDTNVKSNIAAGAAATVLDSEGATNLVFSFNEVSNNQNTGASNDNTDWASILRASVPTGGGSATPGVYLINNEFVGNQAETLVRLETASETDMRELVVAGNIFLNNTITTTEATSNSGPFFNLYYGKNFSLLSNTIVNNTIEGSNWGALVTRGTSQRSDVFQGDEGEIDNTANMTIAVFNNLIYNNALEKGYLINELNVDSTGNLRTLTCDPLEGSNAFDSNWIFGNTAPSTLVDGCNVAYTNGAITVDPDLDPVIEGIESFLGSDQSQGLSTTDPLYYALLGDKDAVPPVFAVGIDAGDETLSTYYDDGGDSDSQPDLLPKDAAGFNNRLLDILNWDSVTGYSALEVLESDSKILDIGAYEFSPLQIRDDLLDLDTKSQGNFDEDSGIFIFDLASLEANTDNEPNIRGGFGNLTITIEYSDPAQLYPQYYGTHCGVNFTDANRGIYASGNLVYYCPPRNFFTDNSSTRADWPDNFSFGYTVRDEGGSQLEGRIQFTIDPTDDAELATPRSRKTVGGAPGQDLTIQLDPYVTFGTASYSINGLGGDDGYDFFYTYTWDGLDTSDPESNDQLLGGTTATILSNALGAVTADGKITVSIPDDAELGFVDFTYQVRDANNGGPITNTIRLSIVVSIPSSGLHDDSSAVWSYHAADDTQPGGWVPLNDADAINNTVHQTTTVGDYAQFTFNGTGFVLYNWYEPSGADWQLEIDGNLSGAWTLLGDSTEVYQATIGSFTCTTQATPDTTLPQYLSNNGRDGYTVNCDSGVDDEHTVKIYNREDRRRLSVDAFSVLNTADPNNADGLPRFGPGTHDADSAQFRQIFDGLTGWTEDDDSRASNDILFMTTATVPVTLHDDADTIPGTNDDPLRFQFAGGTGFALGTIHDRYNVTYTVCVTDKGLDGNATTANVCQDFSNSPDGTRTRKEYDIFRPFYGYNPDRVYEVEISNIQLHEDRSVMYIDSIVVFADNLVTTDVLPYGTTDASRFDYFILGGGVKDSWVFDFNDRNAANGSLIEIERRTTEAGPFMAFQIPADADEFIWQYDYTRRESDQLMICVDRAEASSYDRGNCIIVDTYAEERFDEPQNRVLQATSTTTLDDRSLVSYATNAYMNLVNGLLPYNDTNNDGVLTEANDSAVDMADRIFPAENNIVIKESMFRGASWGTGANGAHTVEIFSLTGEGFNLDTITVINSDDALRPGMHEEYASVFSYYEANNDLSSYTLATPEEYDRDRYSDGLRQALNDYGTDWTFANDSRSRRDSGSATIQTYGIGNAVYFEVTEAVGFAPMFRLDSSSDSVRVCWLQGGGQAIGTILAGNNDNCQILDNGNRGTDYAVRRPILGLDSGQTYSVAVQFIGDNGLENNNRSITRANSRQTEMRFDGVEVYGTDDFAWASLATLANDVRTETSYENREANNQFIYFGGTDRDWRSNTGSRARNQSGADYDQVSRTFSAGIMFKTNSADRVVIYRDTRTSNSDMLVCTAATASLGSPDCNYVDNQGGTGYQVPATVMLTGTGEHIVYVYTLEDRNAIFDAIMPVSSVDTLTNGIYDDTHPAISYDTQYTNLVWGGHMENILPADTGVTLWDGTATVLDYEASRRYNDRRGLEVNFGANEYIESLPFSLQSGVTYTAIARVYFDDIDAGINETTLTMSLQGATGTPSTTEVISFGTQPDRKWLTLRLNYVGASETDVKLRIASSALATLYVDDVYVAEGGLWEQETSRNYYGETRHVSLTHGASVRFTFEGTGFSIGTELNRDGGEMEICYDNHSTSDDDCLVIPNEGNARDVLRTVAGLPLGTYDVVIRDVEDGFSTTRRRNLEARSNGNAVGQLVIDFIQIHNNNTPSAIVDGIYDNTENELLYLPADRWLVETGSRASRSYGGSYTTMAVDGREQRNMAGASIVMELSSNDATLVLYTERTTRNASTPVLVCGGNPDGTISYSYDSVNRRDDYTLTDSTNCIISDNLDETNVIVLPNSQINDTTVSITPLGAGEFKLDRYQVLVGSTVTPGYYEDIIASSLATLSNSGNWATDNDRNFTGESAHMIESVGVETAEFSIVNATGISVVMPFDRDGGDFTINIVDTATSGTNYDETFNFDTYSTSNLYRQALTVAGLPEDDYTVTVTKLATDDNLDGNIAGVFVIDAIEVFGVLNTLGSLYDDAVTDTDGNLILTYGPSLNTWTAEAGSRARAYLNQTYHYTDAVGASVSFAVGTDATGIMVYYGTSSTTTADVCWTDLDAATPVPVCTLHDFGDRAGIKSISVPSDNTNGYLVSLINTEQRGRLYLDAIQILEAELAEGIYNVDYLVLDPNVTLADAELVPGEFLEFNITGIGFSAIFNESTSTAEIYQVCISDTHDSISNVPADCEIFEIVNRADRPSREYALSMMGLHASGTGNDGEYTVRIINSGISDVDLEELHIMGAGNVNNIDGSTSSHERFENDSAYVRYFPFGSYEEVEDRRGGYSGMPSTQHRTRMRGAGVYFEFDSANAFRIGLEQRTSNGPIDVCVGEIGEPVSDAVCYNTIATNDNNIKQFTLNIAAAAPPLGDINCSTATNGCWAFISNDKEEYRETNFDFVSVYSSTDPLLAGWYEDSFPYFVKSDVTGTPGTIMSIGEEERRSSAGNISTFTDFDQLTVTGQALGGIEFTFTGTGFSTYFLIDRYGDNVDMCYQPNTDYTDFDALADGTGTNVICQTFDNYNRRTEYTAARRIVGLPYGTYRAAVVMRDDNAGTRSTSELPTTMKLDAIEIHDEEVFPRDGEANIWDTDFTNLRVLVPGNTYETGFNTAEEDQLFIYYGDDWRGTTGSRARRYSGESYDEAREYGAGIVFRTSGANAVSLITYATRSAPALFCATPVNPDGSAMTANGERACRILETSGRNAYQAPITFQFGEQDGGGYDDEYIVSITSLNSERFYLDAIEVFDATAPMTAGLYQETYAGITYTGTWEQDYNRRYSGESLANSKSDDASASFTFTGTGFEVGLTEHRAGGEVEICYDDTGSNISNTCFTYQQENNRTNYNSARVVTGLPSATYTVTITDVENGLTVTRRNDPLYPRSSRYPVGEIQLDYVRIYNDAVASTIDAGYYDDVVQDNVMFLPDDRWLTITGRSASRYSQESYTTIADNGRSSRNYAGGSFNTQINVADTTTVILYTGRNSRSNSEYLLACVGDVSTGMVVDGVMSWDGNDYSLTGSTQCAIYNETMHNSTQTAITVGSAGDIVVGAGTYNLMVTSLSAGFFNVDGYQIIEDNTLQAGIFDDFLGDNMLDFTGTGNATLERSTSSRDCDLETEWCLRKDSRSYGGFYAYTSHEGATLDFTFEGTGFSVITKPDTSGSTMRVCYAPTGTTLPSDTEVYNRYEFASNVWCDTVTTDTNTRYDDDWDELNQDRINPRRADRYGFAYYGMPNGTYDVQVTMLQSSYFVQNRQTLKIDAIAVFSDASDLASIQNTMVQNDDETIRYEPSVNWLEEESRNQPSRGPLGYTEHVAEYAGSLAQMRINGNSMTIYQTINTRNSEEVRVCVVLSEDGTIHCAPDVNDATPDFNPYLIGRYSQDGRRSYATPVMFYGFGSGTKTVIIENRDDADFSIDAIRVQD